VLGQQLPGRACSAAVTVSLDGIEGSRTGLAVLGRSYLWAGLRSTASGIELVVASRRDGDLAEHVHYAEHLTGSAASIRIDVDELAAIRVVVDGGTGPATVDPEFSAVAGHWIGADIALFAAAPLGAQQAATGEFGPFTLEVAS